MLVVLLAAAAARAAAATASISQGADLASTALRMHAQSTVLPTHLLDDPHMTQGRHLMAQPRLLQALQAQGRYVQIRNPTMAGACCWAARTCRHAAAGVLMRGARPCSGAALASAAAAV
jgi:hypothetical protein